MLILSSYFATKRSTTHLNKENLRLRVYLKQKKANYFYEFTLMKPPLLI